MFRAMYFYGQGYNYRAWVESQDEAKEEAFTHPNPPLGVAVTMRPCYTEDGDRDPSGWMYFLIEDQIRGVGKREFESACV